ncbi:ABC transporter permease, partial [Rhizobium ruizarguesonis]
MVALDINEHGLSSGAWLSKLKGATGPLVGLLALCVFL